MKKKTDQLKNEIRKVMKKPKYPYEFQISIILISVKYYLECFNKTTFYHDSFQKYAEIQNIFSYLWSSLTPKKLYQST